MLIGRKDVLERITGAVLDRSLVVLDGYSGSGKSSLLQNGLAQTLKVAGFEVLVCRRWAHSPQRFEGSLGDKARVERYLVHGMRLTHFDASAPVDPPEGLDLDALELDGRLSHTLDERFGDGVVLILDQFEELLRDQEDTAREIVEWVITSGFRHQSHIVLSLRTDSCHRLEPMLRGVRPYKMDRVHIENLADSEAIEDVIKTMAPKSPSSITQEAVDELMRLWADHHPTLLALQATLYSLYFRSHAASGADSSSDQVTIDVKDVRAMQDDAGPEANPFAFGLRESIRLKIDHAEAACRGERLDEYLMLGAREVVKRIAPLLSSLDFKVPIQDTELTRRALAREAGVLQRAVLEEVGHADTDPLGRRGVNAVVDDFVVRLREVDDFLSARFEDVTAGLARVETDGRPAATRPHLRRSIDVTAGPMMSSSAARTLFEEVRRVFFAVHWLGATEIARKDADGVVQLVHDGSGPALRDWADVQEDKPAHAITQLTGARGEHYVWSDDIDGRDRFEVLANLSWRDCRITTNFHRVVFVNCDFSGSRFEGCAFRGVTFVNCLLDDANFEDCKIIGGTELQKVARERSNEGVETTRVAPSFTVGAPPREVRHFLPYAGGDGTTPDRFFSDTSGRAAMPGSPPSDHPGEVIAHFPTSPPREGAARGSTSDPVHVTPATGGVAMIGGRLSFLTLYRCKARDGGGFSFYYVSGDGFDLVEMDGGTVDIHDVAIRGISVSRDEAEQTSVAARSSAPLVMTVDDSLVSHLYFSDALHGSVTFENSVILMLINASENSSQGFEVHIKNSRYQFLVNTHEPSEDSPEHSTLPLRSRYFEPIPGSQSRFATPNREALANDLEKMDYRFRPEIWEDAQRERRASASRQIDATETVGGSRPDVTGERLRDVT